MLHLSPEAVVKQDVLIPPQPLRIKYDVLFEPILRELDCLGAKNYALEKSRKMLLPRLISGKLSGEGLDIRFPPSMQAEMQKG